MDVLREYIPGWSTPSASGKQVWVLVLIFFVVSIVLIGGGYAYAKSIVQPYTFVTRHAAAGTPASAVVASSTGQPMVVSAAPMPVGLTNGMNTAVASSMGTQLLQGSNFAIHGAPGTQGLSGFASGPRRMGTIVPKVKQSSLLSIAQGN